MATGEPSPTTRALSTPPFQFTLRQIIAVVTFVSIVLALTVQLGWVGLCFSFMGSSVFFILIGARWNDVRWVVSGVIGLILCVVLALLPAIIDPRSVAQKASCQNNLRWIALALSQYHDSHGSYPPAYIADADGVPMHSWRVLLLPYLDQKDLYKQYRFDEPWDGPNNSMLHNVRLKLFDCPSDIHAMTDTSYVAVTGPQTIWPGAKTTKMSDIKDGTSNTIMLVEVHNSGIHWMEPRDLDMSKMPMTVNSPTGLSISSGHPGGLANIALADGGVRAIGNNTSPKSLRAALTIAGGENDRLPAIQNPR